MSPCVSITGWHWWQWVTLSVRTLLFMLNGCANKATRTLINKLTTGLKTDHKLKLIIIHCMFLFVIISTGEYVNKEQISGTQHFSEHIADNSNQPQNYFFFFSSVSDYFSAWHSGEPLTINYSWPSGWIHSVSLLYMCFLLHHANSRWLFFPPQHSLFFLMITF